MDAATAYFDIYIALNAFSLWVLKKDLKPVILFVKGLWCTPRICLSMEMKQT